MVEPTETETKESLDAFADAIEEILAEAETDPEIAKNAPYSTPVRRLDEVRATRKPVVRQATGRWRRGRPRGRRRSAAETATRETGSAAADSTLTSRSTRTPERWLISRSPGRPARSAGASPGRSPTSASSSG